MNKLNILHNDLGTLNILIDSEQIYIIDFDKDIICKEKETLD